MRLNNLTTLDKFFKISLGMVAWATLAWMLFQAANFLNGIVILFGMVALFSYILLAPVNMMERVLRKLMMEFIQFFRLKFLEQHLPSRFPRAISIFIVYLMFVLVMLVTSVRFVPVAFSQLQQFSNQLPSYVHQTEEWILNEPFLQNYFHQEIDALRSRGELSKHQEIRIEIESQKEASQHQNLTPTEKQVIREKIFSTSARINEFVSEYIGGTFNNLLTVISTTLTGFIYALTAVVLIFYLLMDGDVLKNGFVSMLPAESQNTAESLLSSFHEVMYGFVKGQVILGIATGAYMIIIYSIFDVPYALFLGAFFAIAEIIPVFGTWLGFLPGILVLLFMGPTKLLFVAGCVYAFQLIKDNIVAPKVIGKVMGLHPTIVIVSLLVCAKLAGVVGILFAIPFASMINVLIHFFQDKDRQVVQVEGD